jgi:hypothetical protein
MNRFRALEATLAVVMLLFTVGTAAAQLAPTASAECAFLNRYLWRGSTLTHGAVAQPSVTAGLGVMELGVWANMDLANANARSGEFTEVDYTATMTYGLAGIEASAGGVMYTFTQDGAEATTEVFGGLSLSWLLAPSVTVYRDVDKAEGTYISAGLGPSIPIGAHTIDTSTTLGWGDLAHNRYNYGVSVEGITDAGIILSSDVSVTHFLTLRPTLGYTRLISSELRDAAKDPDNVLFGLTVVAGF